MGRNLSISNAPSKAAAIYTINKQFDGLIETAKSDTGGIKGNVLCALDTSGSMTSEIQGANGLIFAGNPCAFSQYFHQAGIASIYNETVVYRILR